MRRLLPASLALVVASAAFAAPAAAQDQRSPNMSLVDNLPYKALDGEDPNQGTDIEFASINGRKYALAGSYYNGMQIVDVTNPERARRVEVYNCKVTQGDIQVFKQGSRTLATYTSDTYGNVDSGCYREAARLGFDVRLNNTADDNGRNGTFIVDISNPNTPKTVGFVEIKQGSHNMTVHPSGNYLYNSNSDLITSTAPAIEIVDIRNPRKPKLAGELDLTPLPGLGTESHDITFNESGTRGYSAALSHGVVIDTSNPAKPTIVSEFDDESINVWHQSDPVTIGGKEYLLVEDEFAGAAGGPVCPSGGVHVYEITGEKEKAPEKVGYWNIADVAPTKAPDGTCTAHVFDVHEKAGLMTIAFYEGGVRVVDLNGLATGEGLKAVGSYDASNANTWAFKAPTVSRNGVFYAYGNDINRGLDVYRYDDRREKSNPGTWVPGPVLPAYPVPGQGGDEGEKDAAAPVDVPAAVGGITQVDPGKATAETVKTVTGVTAKASSAGAPKATAASAGSLKGYRMTCLIPKL
jgi:hypothetical protein